MATIIGIPDCKANSYAKRDGDGYHTAGYQQAADVKAQQAAVAAAAE